MNKLIKLNKEIQEIKSLADLYQIQFKHSIFWLNKKGYLDNKDNICAVTYIINPKNKLEDMMSYRCYYIDDPLEGLLAEESNVSYKIPISNLYQLIDDNSYFHLRKIVEKEVILDLQLMIQLICYSILNDKDLEFIKIIQSSELIDLINSILANEGYSSTTDSLEFLYNINHFKFVSKLINEIIKSDNSLMNKIHVKESDRKEFLSYLL